MTPGTSRDAVVVLPYHADPLPRLCRDLIHQHLAGLPDLSRVTILVDEPQTGGPLRAQLLEAAAEQGVDGLIGLEILSLRDWARRFLPDGVRVCSPVSAELLLIDALRPYRHLFNQANPWLLAGELLTLFRELTLGEIGLPADRESFIDQLQAAYGARDSIRQTLSREATIIHSLWHAWHEQIRASGLLDEDSAHLQALRHSLDRLDPQQQLWLAFTRPLAVAEQQWLQTLLQRDQLHLYLHGQIKQEQPGYPEQHLLPLARQLDLVDEPPPTEPYARLLAAVFDPTSQPLQVTARELARATPDSPAGERLAVLLADHAEQEARAIDIRVRQWLLEGKQRIAIVTENRRLARRVRALLERAGIQLADAAGWALSTTSAAAALERWLECLEEDFAHLPLLDLLKSPFVFAGTDADLRRLATWRLEQDIIRHENIARNLNRYRAHAHDRRKRLANQADITPLLDLLDRLEAAARPLLDLRRGRHPAARWIGQLQESLRLLEMDHALEQDAAGSRLLQLLDRLAGGVDGANFALDWSDFRTWLGRHLERTHFRPRPTQQHVRLLGLAQSQLQQFDALIIAGAEQESLPGHPPISPFFNQQVRHELGLAQREAHYAERFYHIRRLLEAAPAILVTARAEQDGEPVVISHWLEHLLTLHDAAWPSSLRADTLDALSRHAEALQVETEPNTALPATSRQPRPVLDAALLPAGFSPGDYQQLLDCPYQYYAARGLQLKPPEEIREALSKADYGERVHRCLQALHSPVPGLPGPFSAPFEPANRAAAIDCLEAISRAVFADILTDNFEHQGWLSQWRAFIPAYIDWQIIRRRSGWRVGETEQRAEGQLGETQHPFAIRGRLDRIDHGAGGVAIIDYKTGAIPSTNEVQAGEAIQLPFYALLQQKRQDAPVAEVAYLQFDKPEKLALDCPLQDEALQQLSHAVGQRLVQLVDQIGQGQGLPAWGDTDTCKYCDMALLCRKPVWQN